MGVPQLRVGGVWCDDMSDWWGDLEVRHQWGVRAYALSWSMSLDAGERPPALTMDARTELYVGARRLWYGAVDEQNWADGTFTAAGVGRQAEDVYCLTSAGLTTTTPDIAIAAAIARGVLPEWIAAAISATSLTDGDLTDDLNRLNVLLDTVAREEGMRWWVDNYGRPHLSPDPTDPAFAVLPDTIDPGESAVHAVGTLIGRWYDTAGLYTSTTRGAGRPETAIDLSDLGPIDATRAGQVMDSIHARAVAAVPLSSGFTISLDQITTIHDAPVDGAQVAEAVGGGTMVQLTGYRDPRSMAPSTDIVVQESVWMPADDLITLTAIGTAADNLAEIVADEGGVLL